MDVGPLFWTSAEFLPRHFLRDITDQTHLVQWQLVLPCCALHDRRKKGLWIEEARKPDGDRQAKVRCPAV